MDLQRTGAVRPGFSPSGTGKADEARRIGSVSGPDRVAPSKGISFGQVLRERMEKLGGVRFSAHALNRMQTRSINLTQEELTRVNRAVARADEKGAKDPLVLLQREQTRKDLALIVSAKSRTVVTVIDGENLRDNVFTNIDSTVIV